MGQYNQAVLTTAGQALLTSILGNAGTLTFSKFQTSSYQYASGTDLSALTSLQSVEQNVVPSAGGIKDATTFYSSSTVPNTGVTVEYTNYTVGLFATDGDDEVLFAVSTAIVPDIIPVDDGGAPSTYTYTMSIGVSSTANITVEVDDQGILRVSSIVDNLNSTSATQPLSANMGRFLNDKVNYYGVCSTAAGTTAKTASTANGDFTLETGARIVIKFANGSTVDSPTLNIDSTGAKAIYLNGAALDMDFEAGGCYLFVYNGTQFDLLGGGGTVTTVNVSYIGATIDAAIPQGTIVYYLKQKLYKIARDLSGETFPYTIVPSTDFEASGLNGTELLLVDGIPGSGINALDVAFDNTGTGMSAGNVQGAITELNSNMLELILGNGAGIHNALYRGKYLGSSVTADQYAAISAGTFEDLYIGDYWEINGVKWRIAHFDYWLRTGSTEQTNHHAVIVPDENLYNAQMNTSNVTTGGYIGSAMYTANLASAKATVNSAFGSAHVLPIKKYLTNAVSTNIANGWSEVEETVGLMNESMVYGAPINSKPVADSINFNVGYEKTQLALFKLRPELITNRGYWWLRCVVSAAHFAIVHSIGSAYNGNASTSVGVRPAFAIY